MLGRFVFVSLLSFALNPVGAYDLQHDHHLLADVAAQVDGLVAAATEVYQGTTIAPSWSAKISAMNAPTGAPGVQSGMYLYEMTQEHQRFRQSIRAPNHIFGPNGFLVADTLSINQSSAFCQNVTIGEGADSVCKAMPAPFYDPFRWLRAAKQNGTSTVDGENCTVWVLEYTMPGTSSTMRLSASIAGDSMPRELNVSGFRGGKLGNSQMKFSNVQAGPQEDVAFAPSTACATNYPTPACPNQGNADLDVYRVHGTTEPLTLENRNVGDALGDLGFFCLMAANDSSLVSRWTVSANTSWGQYGYCLYNQKTGNVCYGNTGKQVGRESSLGLGEGHLQGQCSANKDVGSWYAFPKEGQCGDGEAIGTNGCTWGAAKRIRTVSASCILKDRGLLQACAAEFGHAPFLKATAIFEAALASSDPTHGGCPDALNASGIEDLTILV